MGVPRKEFEDGAQETTGATGTVDDDDSINLADDSWEEDCINYVSGHGDAMYALVM